MFEAIARASCSTFAGEGDRMTSYPAIVSSRETRLSDWVTLVENSVVSQVAAEPAIYHSFALDDYVSVFPITTDGRVPLVRQFRPAIDRTSLEFPGGILEMGEAPDRCALRELAEEVGFTAADVISLGTFFPDTGRLGNRTWAFVARNIVPVEGWKPEQGVEPLLLPLDDVFAHALNGTFHNGPHVAMIGLALLRGLVDLPHRERGS
jgi:ADP-ribose pyrophosphatase